jgi:hypothetical protein
VIQKRAGMTISPKQPVSVNLMDNVRINRQFRSSKTMTTPTTTGEKSCHFDMAESLND